MTFVTSKKQSIVLPFDNFTNFFINLKFISNEN
jgi:hypothetical protein